MACVGSRCAKAKPEHSGVVLAATSVTNKKPALAFLITGPKNRRFGNNAERSGIMDHKSRLNFEGSSLK